MTDTTGQLDVVVIGAGVSGLHALRHFRQLGFRVSVIEAPDAGRRRVRLLMKVGS